MMQRFIAAILIFLLAAVAAAQDGARLVGPFTHSSLPGGRDLAVSCGGRLFVFGDTVNAAGGDWRFNTGALLVGGRLVALNNDAALWQPDAGALVSVPSGCLDAGGAFYVFYSDMVDNEGDDFTATSSGIVASTDGGATWQKTRLFEGDSGFGQMAGVWSEGAYVLGTEAGRTGPPRLARNPGNLLDRSAYEFWNGAAWVADMNAAAPLFDDTTGELSVCWDGALWRIAYASPRHGGIVERTTPALVGPYSEPLMLVNWTQVPGSYAPQYLACGREFLLSHWQPVTLNGLTWPGYQVYKWQIGL